MISQLVIDALRPYNFRGKLRLLDPVVPRSGERKSAVFGYEVRLDLGEAIQRWVYMGAFEPGETARIREWLRPGMTFLDVGANVGYFTLLAASRVGPGGSVHAIEPSPYAFNKLEQTVRSNGIGQVKLHRMGLSDAAGELTLYVQPRDAGFHSPTMSAAGGGEPVRVPVERLDESLDEWNVEVVDLMKMDVEGHESHVLRGAGDALASGRIRAVLCEFNEHWLRSQGSSSAEMYGLLTDAGFVDRDGSPRFGPDTFETRFLVHRSAPRPGKGRA
jgi:FkbM family methyltransferase